MPKANHINQAQLSELIGVSKQRISQLVKDGVVKLNKKKLLDPVQAKKALLANTSRPSECKKTKDFIVNDDGTCTPTGKSMYGNDEIQVKLPLKKAKKKYRNLADATLALKIVDIKLKESKLSDLKNEIYEEAKKELLKLLEPTFKTIKKLDDSEVDEIITLAQSFGVENIVEFRDELVLLKEKKNNVIIEFEVKNGQ